MDFSNFIGQAYFFFARARAYIVKAAAVTGCVLSLTLSLAAAAADPQTLTTALTEQLRAVKDAQLKICLPAIESLGRSGNAMVARRLNDAYSQEKRPLVRRYIVDALGNLRHRSSLPTLKIALEDADIQVRQSAVAALGLFSPADAQPLFVDHARREKHSSLKRELIHQLAFSDTAESKQAVAELENDADPSVRNMASDTMKQRRWRTGKGKNSK